MRQDESLRRYYGRVLFLIPLVVGVPGTLVPSVVPRYQVVPGTTMIPSVIYWYMISNHSVPGVLLYRSVALPVQQCYPSVVLLTVALL